MPVTDEQMQEWEALERDLKDKIAGSCADAAFSFADVLQALRDERAARLASTSVAQLTLEKSFLYERGFLKTPAHEHCP